MSSIKTEIVAEIYEAIEGLGASPELLSIIGSIGDTVADETVLAWLRAYNRTGTMFETVICRNDDD